MSKKYFHTYVSRYMFQPHHRVFDEDSIKELEKSEVVGESTIYAIVKTPKAKFIPSSFEVTDNYSIIGLIECYGKHHKIIFNMAKYWFEGESELSKDMRSKFKTIDDFIDYGLAGYRAVDGSSLSNSKKYQCLAEVDIDSTEDQLIINCPIATGLNAGRTVSANLFVYQLVNHYDIDLLSNLEICYIGKSNRNTFNRLKKHEKWGPVLSSKKNDHFDYFAYFFVINEAATYNLNLYGSNLMLTTSSGLPKGAITDLCEATLINYFKPEFNREFVNSDIPNTKLVKDWLLDKGFDAIMTEFELDGLMGRLSTKVKPYSKRHVFESKIAQHDSEC